MKKKIIISVAAAIIIAGAAFFIGFAAGRKKESRRVVTYIDYPQYQELLKEKETFVVDIVRPSCRYCAIVESLLPGCADGRLPIYVLNLESYRDTDAYEKIKGELGITYVPTFYYIEDGTVKYGMNSPLTDSYYDEKHTSEDRNRLSTEARQKINDFIDGACGKKEPVNEEILKDIVVAMPVKTEDKNAD